MERPLKLETSPHPAIFPWTFQRSRVSHPASDGGVSQGFTHQVAQQGVGSQETQTDVGGFGEVAEDR